MSRRRNDDGFTSVLCTFPESSGVSEPIACVGEEEARFLHHQLWNVAKDGEYLQQPIRFDTSVRDTSGKFLLFDVGSNIGLVPVRFGVHLGSENLEVHAWEPVDALRRCAEDNGRRVAKPSSYAIHSAALGAREDRLTFATLPKYSLLSGVGRESVGKAARQIAEYLVDCAQWLPETWREQVTSDYVDLVAFVRDTTNARDAILQRVLDEVVSPRLEQIPVEMQLTTLSAEIDRLGVANRKVSLCKIDVEGAEMNVLRGIRDEHWPLFEQLIIEVHHVGSRVRDMVSLLRERGFKTIVERPNGPPLFLLFTVLGLTEPPPGIESAKRFETLSTIFATRAASTVK